MAPRVGGGRSADALGVQDVAQGAEEYVELRERWHAHVMALAPTTAHELYESDPAGCRPEEIDARPPFRRRLTTLAI